MIDRIDWYGCYDGSWQSAPLVAEAFAHPAKVSFNLAERIYRHMLAEGWLSPGDAVFDPFGGVGGFAFHAALYGMHWTGVELEQKFVDLGGQNLELWRNRYAPHFPGYGSARLVQGDSRRLVEVVTGAGGVVSSPPYSANTVGGKDGIDWGNVGDDSGRTIARGAIADGYGHTDGNLGNMPAGIVSSPPYSETRIDGNGDEGASGLRDENGNYLRGAEGWAKRKELGARYGGDPANLGNMPAGVVSSPPFEGVVQHDGKQRNGGKDLAQEGDGYGSTAGNLGNMAGAMAKPNYAIHVNRGIIKGKEIIPCQTVKTVEPKLSDEADGASLAPKSMLAPASRDARSTKDLGPSSLPQSSTSQCLTAGEKTIPIGTAAANPGADTLGESSAAQLSSVTGTSVLDAETLSDSKFITNLEKTRPAVNGTMSLTTSKHSASDAISISTDPENTTPFVRIAESIIEPNPQGLHVLPNVSDKGLWKLKESSTQSDDPPSTFWEAAATIVAQCYAILKPGGYAAWVTGDFVRNKQRVPFGEQWLALCVSAGFEPVLWATAWKAEQHGEQLDIFGNGHEQGKTKVSFFRRLANSKSPDTAIVNEDVLFLRKPQ